MLQIGSRVKILVPVDGKHSIQYEFGRAIYIGRRVLVEFFRNICGHNGNGIGRDRHCWMVSYEVIEEV